MTPEELAIERNADKKDFTTAEMRAMLDEEQKSQSEFMKRLMTPPGVSVEEMVHTYGASIATFGLILDQLLREREREAGEGK